MIEFPMLPDASDPNRLPAPSPCKACMISKTGWFTAVVATLIAAFFFFRFITANADAKLQRSSVELSRVDIQALKQQLFAERILAERQIAELKAKTAPEPTTFVTLLPPQANAAISNGIIAWQQSALAGTFLCDQLPIPAQDEEYCLWLESSSDEEVGAGVIAIGTGKTIQAKFAASHPVKNGVKRIFLTRERKGGSSMPRGPVILTGFL